MEPARLEAFTDGVVAIIITIMVLEIHVPQGRDLASLQADVPVLLAYLLSYVNVGIFWNNHHHMLQVTERVDGKVLWANLALLFWLSLVPFVIRWIDESGFTALPTAAYGVVLTCAAISYTVLERQIIAVNGHDSRLAVAVGNDTKGKFSILLYVSAIFLAFFQPFIAIALYIVVAVIWLVPDSRIEGLIKKN
ncbi:MAG TPA: TMEM175 family protein [Steroidobacteraceae bacterium]|nr:TMEM175 family protein [Steroidobacteraceae bacterium]